MSNENIPSEASHVATTETRKADASPIILDIGRKNRKQVKQLRQGKGKLLQEVNNCIEELKTSGNITASAQPVIVIVRERPRRPDWPWPMV